jgi:putative phosphoribosyl transferase
MGEIIDDPRLRDKNRVFTGRHDAGKKLGAFIKTLPAIPDPLVLAIPAGGVPVGKEVAIALGPPLLLAIVTIIDPEY